MLIEFPLREIRTEFGILVDPTIELPVKTPHEYLRFRFLLDSGSDFTMMPRSVAEQLGVNLESAREVNVTGIEGSEVKTWLSEITLKIGETEHLRPCLFSSNEGTPCLLGRMKFFQRFNVTFDNRDKKLILEPIEPEPAS